MERVYKTTFHEYFLLVEGFLFRQGEEQRLIRRICYEVQMSNQMLKPVFRPKSPLDMWRTYGELEKPKQIEIAEEDLKADEQYFANKGKKILY